ncbi:FXYD domain-containing ion transport regulator 5-like isoform X2 [Bufo gargarizans]|uniref:FXYD domain-containing ion transport regulator 5-like isoform X2 n=1 Tax=Bufo gargarizans TaxID=30331 RepID=UPI001CF15506|nr:FXYD domain-containing ion transport regulator 5-like isoform X2 [Bufo gargarizans]
MINCKRNPGVRENVPGLLLLILILPVTPAPAGPTLQNSTGQSTEHSEAFRTTPAYSDLSQNSTSNDSTDPTATTKGPEYSTIFAFTDGTRWQEPDSTNNTRIRDEAKIKEQDDRFIYDDYSLKKWGLICALILSIIGILVLFSGRCRGSSCRKRQKQRYNVSGI